MVLGRSKGSDAIFGRRSVLLRSLALTALVVVMVASGVAAGGANAADDRTLVVGVEELDYMPMYSTAGGEYHGVGRDILDAFARDAGYTLVYKALPVPRLYASFFAGQVDLKFPDNAGWKAEDRDGKEIFYTAAPLVVNVDASMVKPEDLGKGPDAVKVLGIVIGFSPWAWTDRINDSTVTVVENPDFAALLRQVVADRVDAAYASVPVMRLQSREIFGHDDALVFDPSLPYAKADFHVSSLSRPEVIAEMDAWMADHVQEIVDLRAKYGIMEEVALK